MNARTTDRATLALHVARYISRYIPPSSAAKLLKKISATCSATSATLLRYTPHSIGV